MRISKAIFVALSFVAAILALAAFPVLLEVRDGRVALNLARALSAVGHWFLGLFDGGSWSFSHGPTTWSFLQVVPKFAGVTFLYLLVPGALGIASGFAFGLLRDPTSAHPARGLMGAVLDVVYSVPDFILAVLVQIFAIVALDATGVRLFKVSYDTRSGLLLALPVFVMAVYPFIHSYRTVRRTAAKAGSSYFVLNAKARGVSGASLRYKHVGAAVLSSLSTDLPSIMAMMMTSIFVVEYTFALPGLTRWLFTVAFSGTRVGWYNSYQYPLAVNILFCIAAAYFLVLLAFRGLLSGIREAMIHAL